jgi:hypothetical protein
MNDHLKLLRRTHYVDELVKKKLDKYHNSYYFNICDYDLQQFIQIVGEGIIENMYFQHFGDIDDNSKEWDDIYNVLVKYIESVHMDTIIDFYNEHCPID